MRFGIKMLTLTMLITALSMTCSCGSKPKYTDGRYAVEIITTAGIMVIELYNETPQHRDNFIKLIENKFYEGVHFHRVISDFMIQTGDPETKNFSEGRQYGTGGPGYTIPAEFIDTLYHKKGAVAAARQGDQVNPEKASSGSQFYIVQGKVYNDTELLQFEQAMTHQKKLSIAQAKVQNYYFENETKLRGLTEEQLKAQIQEIGDAAYTKADGYTLSKKAKEIYSTLGGTPFLDGEYTVFGEVVEGIEVIDQIAKVSTNTSDQPLEPIIIKETYIIQRP